MAAARTTEDQTITASDVYRELISEAVKVRVRDCSRSHRGPVKDGTCGHCGGGTK